jgi:NAD(P)H-hydrate repair Nnr-like enzyme with NAD(P)H-hydrate dehydratase domain
VPACARRAGTIAAFISWLQAAERASGSSGNGSTQAQQEQQGGGGGDRGALTALLMQAAYGGCITMRAAARLGWQQRGRSLVAGDMIEHLGDPALQHAGLL